MRNTVRSLIFAVGTNFSTAFAEPNCDIAGNCVQISYALYTQITTEEIAAIALSILVMPLSIVNSAYAILNSKRPQSGLTAVASTIAACLNPFILSLEAAAFYYTNAGVPETGCKSANDTCIRYDMQTTFQVRQTVIASFYLSAISATAALTGAIAATLKSCDGGNRGSKGVRAISIPHAVIALGVISTLASALHFIDQEMKIPSVDI